MKTETLIIRLTPDEKQFLDRYCSGRRFTKSHLIRQLILALRRRFIPLDLTAFNSSNELTDKHISAIEEGTGEAILTEEYLKVQDYLKKSAVNLHQVSTALNDLIKTGSCDKECEKTIEAILED